VSAVSPDPPGLMHAPPSLHASDKGVG